MLNKANNGNDIYTERAGITIFYGQNDNNGLVKDATANPVRFANSMLSVLNFMAFNGWEYVGKADDLISAKGRDSYLFRKKK